MTEHNHDHTFTTAMLVPFVKFNNGRWVECQLTGSGGLRATHVLTWKRGKLHDHSFVDGTVTRWAPDDFEAHYKGGVWIVNQVEG